MKTFKRVLLIAVAFLIIYAAQYAWRAFPIISGYSAKDVCSCVFVAGRDVTDVVNNELNSFPLSLGRVTINAADSSATATVWGMAKRKAIYRRGLGCTLVVGLSEEEIRNQHPRLATTPSSLSDSLPWPVGNKSVARLPQEIDSVKLNQAIDHAFLETSQEPMKLNRTRAVAVIYNGQIIAERYAPGYTKDSKHIGWSMTKSVTNALVGILVKQGKLSLDQTGLLEPWRQDDRKTISLRDLLHMSSGLSWEENYGGPSGATNMLFKEKDMGIYAAEVPLEFKPGEVFEYSSGTTNIVSHLVRKTIGDDDYYSFPQRELFQKIGMTSIVMEPDAGGTFVGSSYSFATAQDFARFGLLYLNDGVWNGERILPENWVTFSSTPTSGAHRGEYGAHWWTNAGEKNNPAARSYPSVPTDSFQAEGFEGQYIFVIPSKKLVVVRLGLTKSDRFDINGLVGGIVSSIH